jgi:LacI family gluconate utilization system Gnt-I transcriptional repressor
VALLDRQSVRFSGSCLHKILQTMPRSKPPGRATTTSIRAAQRAPSAVTIHEVARLADVSLITVSRALNSPNLLSARTLQRVLDAIASTGYVPNLMAGGLRSSKSRLVAALVPTLFGQLFAEMVQSLTDS